MKTKNVFLLPVLIAGLNLLPAGRATAQTFATVKSFGILTNISGFNPQSTLVQGPDGTLYGTARNGETSVAGTVFKVGPDGNGFTVLKWFTNSIEGANPIAGLVLSGGQLYGTTSTGGSSNFGTVFKLNTDGTDYTVLNSFVGSDGANPYYAALTLSGNALYGTAYYGGNSNSGTLFKLNTDGTGYTVLKHFAASDGANPNATLTVSGSVVYGTTENGGSSGVGTLFKVNTDGTSYTVLHNFTDNPDGAFPDCVLTLSGSQLFGTTYRGGNSYYGTVFKVNTDGTGYTVLKNLDHDNDGANPAGALPLSGGVLYGTASDGGSSGSGVVIQGTVFKLNTNGTGYTVLKNFAGGYLDGATPVAGLMLSGSQLFGTTAQGGAGKGVVFKLNTDGSGYDLLKQFVFSDGAYPVAPLTLSGGVLYGTTRQGGGAGNADGGNGTAFKVNTDGTGSTMLHIFTGASFSGTNSDGYWPQSGLVLSGNTLYGTSRVGGGGGDGTVFAVNTDGTGFTTLHDFVGGTDGAGPDAGLILSGQTLYGTTTGGTVFAVQTDGTGFTTLHNFTGGSDGGAPRAGLISSPNKLYGTASSGGSSGRGTVFALNTDGTGFATLHSFSATPPYPNNTNSDGASPSASLFLSGNTLYGTAQQGGFSGRGTVFAVSTDGTSFINLHSFNGSSDGWAPAAGVILVGNTLYGTTQQGGSSSNGTVFAVNTDGTGFTTLHSFTPLSADWTQGGANLDGSTPLAGLILSGDTLYGTTQHGGALGYGTVFSLSFTPQLTIAPSGPNVILSWPTNVAGFDYTAYALQATTNLASPAIWSTNSPGPVVVNGQNTVTNPITGAQQFYRLVH